MDIKSEYKLIPYFQRNVTVASKLTSDLNVNQNYLKNRYAYTQNKNYRYFENFKPDYTIYNKNSSVISSRQNITGSLIDIFV